MAQALPEVDSEKKPPAELNPADRAKPCFSVSVRDLVEFVLREGDLGRGSHFGGQNRALEGTRGHQRVQKSRPAGYQSEVAVSCELDTPELLLKIKGRIDGLQEDDGTLLIEEIKTVSRPWNGPADSLHLAQAKTYAALYTRERSFEGVTLQITYLDLQTESTAEFREKVEPAELEHFFHNLVAEYIAWLTAHLDWLRRRDIAGKQTPFPYPAYREGQRKLAVAVYQAIRRKERLFAEAPTGIGKTISVLFPALKALSEGKAEKVFYLTAKTATRSVAEKAAADLRQHGAKLRAVTLTAKEKICFNNGAPCDPAQCPFALGYYDRIKPALRAALREEVFTRAEIERLAREHQVCPFEFSLDLAVWCDLVICDYNYAFDPSASLKRFFSDEKRPYVLLIDEAHNLTDRAREMFSAELRKTQLTELKQALGDEVTAVKRALGRVIRKLNELGKSEEWIQHGEAKVTADQPAELRPAIQSFIEAAEEWLVQDLPAEFRPALMEGYFNVLSFSRTLEAFSDAYRAIKQGGSVRLFCLHPAARLHEILENVATAIFFSATLRPIDYYKATLGGDPGDASLQLSSPFPPENLKIWIESKIATRFQQRSRTLPEVVNAVGRMVAEREGNYLVFFPSHQYLKDALEKFRGDFPDVLVEAQTGDMTEQERDLFLARFTAQTETSRVGFAVLGGVFGEGIDLVGDRLIGVAVVGVGLPQLCLERDLIRDYYNQQGQSGFDFAYTFPGMNRVLQAAGRLIRSETDRGTLLLIDQRFNESRYRRLYPPWWRPAVRSFSENLQSSDLKKEQPGEAMPGREV